MNTRLSIIGVATLGLTVGAFAFAHGVVEHDGASKELKYFQGAQQMELEPMGEPGVDSFFSDIVGSGDAKAPISCGLFKIEQGKELVYTYDYDDVKLMLEGNITFSDGKQEVSAKPGDVLFFPKGSTITFSTKNSGLAFACGQREEF